MFAIDSDLSNLKIIMQHKYFLQQNIIKIGCWNNNLSIFQDLFTTSCLVLSFVVVYILQLSFYFRLHLRRKFLRQIVLLSAVKTKLLVKLLRR